MTYLFRIRNVGARAQGQWSQAAGAIGVDLGEDRDKLGWSIHGLHRILAGSFVAGDNCVEVGEGGASDLHIVLEIRTPSVFIMPSAEPGFGVLL